MSTCLSHFRRAFLLTAAVLGLFATSPASAAPVIVGSIYSENNRTTNIIIKATADGMVVTSSFLIYRFRMGESSPYVGWYEHKLKRVDGQLKIHHRKAVLDMEALSEHGAVSIIL